MTPFRWFIVTLAEFGLTKLGLILAASHGTSAPVWPATGFAIAVMLKTRCRAWPAILVGSFLAFVTAKASLEAVFGLTIASCVEATVGAEVSRRVVRYRSILQSHTPMTALLAGAFAGSFAGALVGLPSLCLTGVISWGMAPAAAFTWLTGNAVGGLMTGPFTYGSMRRSRKNGDSILPWLLFPIVSVFFGACVFGTEFGDDFAIFLLILLVPIMLFGGRAQVRLATVLLGAIAVMATFVGSGPFASGSIFYRSLGLQLYLVALTLTSIQLEALRRARALAIVAPILVAGFTASATVFYIFSVLSHRKDEAHMDSLVFNTERVLREKLSNYENVMHDAAALVSMKGKISHAYWRNLTEKLQVSERLPGAKGIGIVSRVAKKDIPRFIREQRSEGLSDFEVRLIREGEFPEAWVISHIEPSDQNFGSIGLDLVSEPSRKRALELGRDTGTMAMTGQVSLLNDEQGRSGFIFYYPVFHSPNLKDFDIEQRKRNHFAWIMTPVVSDLFLQSAVPQSNELEFALHDSDPSQGANLIFQTQDFGKHSAFHSNTLQKTTVLEIGNRKFHAHWRSGKAFTHAQDGVLAPLGGMGALLTLVIAWMFANIVTFKRRGERMVDIQTRRIEEDHRRLVEAQKMATLGEMASGIAHEINNPLTIIMGRVQGLRGMAGKEIPGDKLIEIVEKIEKPANRIMKIVRGLRTYMRRGDGDPMEPVMVKTIVEDTLELLAQRFRKAEVALTTEGTTICSISCRATQISQVLLNLLGNALDAVEGTPDAWVRLSVSQVEYPNGIKRVRFSVIDSGKGVAPEIASRIMEPFFSTKEVGKGTGLGLSISKSIVHEHGGELRILSESPNTCFYFELPEAVVQSAPLAA